MKIIFYQDASHGWYAVKRSVLQRLGLLNSISSYSYQSYSGKTVYLEEDCDAPKLFEKLHELNIHGVVIDAAFKNKSHIRNLDGFKL